MRLLEYEAKQLLKSYDVPVPESQLIHGADAQLDVDYPVVLKVQIPKGGRGKAGGVRLVNTVEEYRQIAAELLSKPILGCDVTALLAEEVLGFERELYLAFTIDRATASVMLLAHCNGGVEIEHTVATPGMRAVFTKDIASEPDAELVAELSAYFDLSDAAAGQLGDVLRKLYAVFITEDVLLLEINPLMVLDDGRLVCADAKMELDDAAAFRHTDRDFAEKAASSQFVELDSEGTVASMANGAGLAMATVDAIKTAGAEPANFFDVGGGTNVQGMVRAFTKISDMPNVASIVVNIFGGITRCDEVAEAIIEAQKVCKRLPQLYIRLTGTNEMQGKKLLEAAGIAFYPSLSDCVEQAVRGMNESIQQSGQPV